MATERLKIWPKAKELRLKYYRDYAEAHERGALRYSGSAWNIDAVPKGLSGEVYSLTGEAYGAACAFDEKFSARALAKADSYGFAKDMCAYFRNYVGSYLLGEYLFGGPMPKPDFIWTAHICCLHSKWYQDVSEIEGGIPMYSVDVASGAPPPFSELHAHKIKYIADQLLDGIEWLQKVTGRPFDDEKFIQAAKYRMNSIYKWLKVCELNQNVPAPLGEKEMFTLYVFGTLQAASKESCDFYDELYEEVEDRVRRGVAAIGNEQLRVMTDSQPPWSFLDMWRHLEREYNAVSIGSLYTFGVQGSWEVREGKLFPKEPLDPGSTRESACWALAEWELYKIAYLAFYHPDFKSQVMTMIAKQWKVDGVIMHLNKGCEGSSMGVLENKIALEKAGVPCLTVEGSMADDAAVDKERIFKGIDIFLGEILKRATMASR